MLSKKEKEEMLADGKNPVRRRDFAWLNQKRSRTPYSLDDFICFLKGFQKIFSLFSATGKKMIAKQNKL